MTRISSFRLGLRAWLFASLLSLLALPATGRAVDVDAMHWWVSDGERASIDVLAGHVRRQGLTWRDTGVAGSGTTRYFDALRARIQAGRSPMASQMIGFEIREWAARGLLDDLDDAARRGEWDEVVPIGIQALSKYQGRWYAAPINAHSTNWLWVNQALLDRIGGTAPDIWDDLIVLLERARKAGIQPLAIGREAWEHTLLFESVAVSTAGAEFYRRAFLELDASALDDAVVRRIFQRMRVLAGYVDPGFMRRRWDQATDRVRKGQSLLQVQGSWVGGEFTHHGMQPGKEYACFRFPDTQGVFLFNSDQYVLLRGGPGTAQSRDAFLSILMDPAFQAELNQRTGAAPARVDVPKAAFNACGQRAIDDMRGANMRRTMMGSIAMGNANPPAVKTAIYDVVTRHFQGALTDDQAVQALRDAIGAAP